MEPEHDDRAAETAEEAAGPEAYSREEEEQLAARLQELGYIE
ncbi:hypothetical protein Skr01_69080 [Sphaerisporangium krabiense]|uniref:Uncharacterized protein n=1 Tax=Sphaerisporangium krabiense TaxID=763782 RepID=A0A7W8Z7D3_9ACTN|nr:hypothetical protein [Sphaerisporangium krabiense]MBB5628438.1 hypothetical protein [Sphaerisporangium krabiense]GII66823.1 hypothetical protein Skr01_69080 [Sphaerisporangium krabiense]